MKCSFEERYFYRIGVASGQGGHDPQFSSLKLSLIVETLRLK